MTSFSTLIGALLALAIYSFPATARGVKDYQQTVWTQQEGAPTELMTMAQTIDGWLWVGSGDGLFRFDGVNFEPYVPAGQPQLAHQRVVDLHAAENGDLYISYFPREVIVVRADGRVELLPQTKDNRRIPPLTMAVDRDQTLWTIGHGIRRYANGEWLTVESDPVWTNEGPYSLLLDQDQRLWASAPSGVWRLDRASGRFIQASSHGGGLLIAPNGDVWVAAPRGGQAVRIATSATGKPRPLHAAAAGARVTGQFAADGTLWALGCPEIACLVRDAAAASGPLLASRDAQERVTRAGAAAGQDWLGVLEDRQGNLWIFEHNALSRYRPKRFQIPGFDLEDYYYSIADDRAGALWIAETHTGKLWRLSADGTPQVHAGPPAYLLASAREGGLWAIGDRGIDRVMNGVVKQTIALPPGKRGTLAGRDLIGLLDDGERLWTASPATGAVVWTNGQWQPGAALDLPPGVYLSQTSGQGKLWLALSSGELVFQDHGKLDRYDARSVGIATGIFPGPQLVLGGTNGLAVLRDGKLHMLSGAQADALRGVSGIAVTADGDRWLNGVSGVVHVRAQDWQRTMAQPDEPLRYELFGVADGYPGRASIKMRRPTALSPDGRHVWLMTTTGLVGLDSADLRRNTVAPRPVVLEVNTEKARYAAASDVHLPAGASNFRLRYTALSARQPERTRFEYWLEGVDATWQDGDQRRTTSYTNVAPGDYVFRVRAINEDGVVSEAAAVRLTLAPTLVQSLPFRLACAAALLLLAVMLYRLRVRYLTARLLERLQIKLDERERIARTLHDTFLQSVQALLLRLRRFERSLPQDDAARQELHTLLGEVQGTIEEGRDQVHELRDPGVRTLEEVLRTSAAGLAAIHAGVAFSLNNEGIDPGLAPLVVEEAGWIAGEALRNAFSHAQASRIDVRIRYGAHGCTLVVADDGCGLDAAEATRRGGRWGLVGMRERATRIGARLEMDSGQGQGTTVTLHIPPPRPS